MSSIPSLDERIAAQIQPMRPKARYSRKTEIAKETLEQRRNRHLRTRLEEINKGCDRFFRSRNLDIPSVSHSMVHASGEEGTAVRKFVSRLRQSRIDGNTQLVDP